MQTAKLLPRIDLAKDFFSLLRQISGAVYVLDHHTSCEAVTGHQGGAAGRIVSPKHYCYTTGETLMNMKVKHVITTTFSSLLAIALLVPQPAAATDDKTFPGEMCQPSGGDVAIYFTGSFNTDPNSGHYLTCPVVRDTMADSSLSSASMYVIDDSPVEDVLCELRSGTADGSLVASSSGNTSGVDSAASQLLQFGGLSSASGGNYRIVCRIPKAAPNNNFSGILSYRINEND